ncbi:MAG: hypothetical protein SGPRY_000972, partial [Prymnesium sp.]
MRVDDMVSVGKPVVIDTPVVEGYTLAPEQERGYGHRFADDFCSCLSNVPICLATCCLPCVTTGQLYERVMRSPGSCIYLAAI